MPVRKAVLVGDALQPTRLGHRVFEKARLDVDGLDQPDAGHIGEIVGEKVIADERRGAAEHHLTRAVGEPCIPAGVELPEMVVGIGDRAVVEAAHGLLHSYLSRTRWPHTGAAKSR